LLSVPSPVTAILTVSPGLRNRGGLNRVIADIKKTLNDGVAPDHQWYSLITPMRPCASGVSHQADAREF
jgi:hypothetical protein